MSCRQICIFNPWAGPLRRKMNSLQHKLLELQTLPTPKMMRGMIPNSPAVRRLSAEVQAPEATPVLFGAGAFWGGGGVWRQRVLEKGDAKTQPMLFQNFLGASSLDDAPDREL